jgi:23S rRNA (guanosine2251-2'-O)-methyltransferase
MTPLAGIHAVREALRAGVLLDRVHVARGAAGARLDEIVALCRQNRVALRFDPRETLDRLAQTSAHQGVVALCASAGYVTLEEVLGGGPLVVLDGVEDPHNLGAILRTAYAAGAKAVVLPERRAVGLTGTVAKSAAGALAVLPVARVTNLNRALEQMKKSGYWIYGLDERGEQAYWAADYSDPCAFVLGGEGHGLHEQVRRHCDFLVRIPMAGQIASLNVSVAAGVVLFDWRRKLDLRPKSGI